MKKCKLCGGACVSVGNGQYQCDCCGNTFSEDDFTVGAMQSVKTVESTKDSELGADILKKM